MSLAPRDEKTGRYLPVVYPEEKPFWDAAKQRRLMLQRCRACGKVWYPIGPTCPFCLSNDLRLGADVRPRPWSTTSSSTTSPGSPYYTRTRSPTSWPRWRSRKARASPPTSSSVPVQGGEDRPSRRGGVGGCDRRHRAAAVPSAEGLRPCPRPSRKRLLDADAPDKVRMARGGCACARRCRRSARLGYPAGRRARSSPTS